MPCSHVTVRRELGDCVCVGALGEVAPGRWRGKDRSSKLQIPNRWARRRRGSRLEASVAFGESAIPGAARRPLSLFR